MLVGAFDGAAQAFLSGRLTPRFGERRVLVGGLIFGVGAFILMGAASVGWVFLLGIPLMALWSLAGPPIQAIMTHEVDASEQGRLQGAVTSLGSFAGIFGPYLFAQIFASSIAPDARVHLPGLAFMVAAVLLLIGTVIAVRVTRGLRGPLSGESIVLVPDPLVGDVPPLTTMQAESRESRR